MWLAQKTHVTLSANQIENLTDQARLQYSMELSRASGLFACLYFELVLRPYDIFLVLIGWYH